MDGMIASIANSNNGEVSIVAQVSSVGVETGFNATELGLWPQTRTKGKFSTPTFPCRNTRNGYARTETP